jgi:hypothetical protein
MSADKISLEHFGDRYKKQSVMIKLEQTFMIMVREHIVGSW